MKKLMLFLMLSAFGLQPFAQTIEWTNTGIPDSFLPEISKTGYQVKKIQLPTGVELEYAEQGEPDGIPVIFLHGITDSRHSFDLILPLLPTKIHAFSISMRGHGNSSQPLNGYIPFDFANDIRAFMEKLNIEKAIIAGHSLGGVVAQRFAISFPEKLQALILISTSPRFITNGSILELRNTIQKFNDPVDRYFIIDFQKSTLNNPISQSFFDTVVNECSKVALPVWKKAFDGLVEVNYSDQLQKVTRPTLAIWGRHDAICSEEDQQVLKSSIRNLQFKIYDDAGHAPHWEYPHQVAKNISEFVLSISK